MTSIYQTLFGWLPPVFGAALLGLLAILAIILVLNIVKIVLDAIPFL